MFSFQKSVQFLSTDAGKKIFKEYWVDILLHSCLPFLISQELRIRVDVYRFRIRHPKKSGSGFDPSQKKKSGLNLCKKERKSRKKERKKCGGFEPCEKKSRIRILSLRRLIRIRHPFYHGSNHKLVACTLSLLNSLRYMIIAKDDTVHRLNIKSRICFTTSAPSMVILLHGYTITFARAYMKLYVWPKNQTYSEPFK